MTDTAERQYGSAENARNMNPHAEAVVAMTLWGFEYSRQNDGCMDFWDALPDRRKRLVRELLDRCSNLPREVV